MTLAIVIGGGVIVKLAGKSRDNGDRNCRVSLGKILEVGGGDASSLVAASHHHVDTNERLMTERGRSGEERTRRD